MDPASGILLIGLLGAACLVVALIADIIINK